MKKSIFAIMVIAAGVVAVVCSCNKESINNVNSNPIEAPHTKEAYPPDPSWARVSSSAIILRSRSQSHWNCINQVRGYFCGIHLLETQEDGPAIAYIGLEEPLGLQIKCNFLIENDLPSLIDSAKNGSLSFHADIEVLSEQLQRQLGFTQIPAGKYPAMILGDTAIYVRFKNIL